MEMELEQQQSNPDPLQPKIEIKTKKQVRDNTIIKYLILRNDLLNVMKRIVAHFPDAQVERNYFRDSQNGQYYLKVNLKTTSAKKAAAKLNCLVADSLPDRQIYSAPISGLFEQLENAGLEMVPHKENEKRYQVVKHEKKYSHEIPLTLEICGQLLATFASDCEEPLQKYLFIDTGKNPPRRVKTHSHFFGALINLIRKNSDILEILDNKIIQNSVSLLLNEKYISNRNIGSQLITSLLHIYEVGTINVWQHFDDAGFIPKLTSYFGRQWSSDDIQQQILSLILDFSKTDETQVALDLYQNRFMDIMKNKICHIPEGSEYYQIAKKFVFFLIEKGPFSQLENFDKCFELFNNFIETKGDKHIMDSDIIEFITQIMANNENFFCRNERIDSIHKIISKKLNQSQRAQKLLFCSLLCLQRLCDSDYLIDNEIQESVGKLLEEVYFSRACGKYYVNTIWRLFERGFIQLSSDSDRDKDRISKLNTLLDSLKNRESSIERMLLAFRSLNSSNHMIAYTGIRASIEILNQYPQEILQVNGLEHLLLNIEKRCPDLDNIFMLALNRIMEKIPQFIEHFHQLPFWIIHPLISLLQSNNDQFITNAISCILKIIDLKSLDWSLELIGEDFNELLVLLVRNIETTNEKNQDLSLHALDNIIEKFLNCPNTNNSSSWNFKLLVTLLTVKNNKALIYAISLISKSLENNSRDIICKDVIKLLLQNLKIENPEIQTLCSSVLDKIIIKTIERLKCRKSSSLSLDSLASLLESHNYEYITKFAPVLRKTANFKKRKLSQFPYLKHAVKNFGRAIAAFARSYIATPYLEPLIFKENVTLQEFRNFVGNEKNRIDGMSSFRHVLLITLEDSPKLAAFKKILREISVIFIKYFSVNWICNSRLGNKEVHLKCRFQILRRVMDPEHFTYPKPSN